MHLPFTGSVINIRGFSSAAVFGVPTENESTVSEHGVSATNAWDRPMHAAIILEFLSCMSGRVTDEVLCSLASIIQTAENDYLVVPDRRPVPAPWARQTTLVPRSYAYPSGIHQFESPHIIEMVGMTLDSCGECNSKYTEQICTANCLV
jgi:hypothetical protein